MMNFFSKIWQIAVAFSMLVAPVVWAKITIYMCGDSTMQDYEDGYYPRQGQGQDFQFWFDPTKVTVVNRGQGGMSLGGGGKDRNGNIAVGYYDMFFKSGCSNGNCIADKLQSGDYVVVQFGINDVNYSTPEFFTSNMGKLVSDVRAKGAYPIIMSPIRRLYYDSPTQIHNSYRGYPALNQHLADSLDVPFIDMSEMVANFMISVGYTYAEQFLFNFATTSEYSNLGTDAADQVHLQMNGANAFGRIITEQMRAHSNPVVKKLGDYMVPMYQVDVKVSPEGAAEATSINAYYPQGMTVLLKTIPKSDKRFLGWYDGNGNKVGSPSRDNVKSPYIHTFVMGDKATQYTAVYEGGSAQKYTGDGKALAAFPTTTPKSLDDVTFVPFTPMEGTTQIDDKVDKNIKKFFDAYMPDSGVGYSENNNPGFTGKGFWNFVNETNSYGVYRMTFPSAGRVTLGVIYANGGKTDRFFNAYLDHDYYISAPPTGDFYTWDTAYVVLDVPRGEADLRFISLTSDGGPNIDAFGFSLDGVCRTSDTTCKVLPSETLNAPETKTDTGKVAVTDSSKIVEDSTNAVQDSSTTAGIRGDVLRLAGAGNALVKVYDMNGRLVKSQMVAKLSEISLSSMVKANGIYRIVVKQGSTRYSTTWAKVK